MAFVQGTDGNDSLSDAQGGDVFQGGLGNDTISGGRFYDRDASSPVTVIYNPGDGNDILASYSWNGHGIGYGHDGCYIVQFGAGIRLEDLVLQSYSWDDDRGSVGFVTDSGSLTFGGVVLWRFADGQEVNKTAMLNWFNLGVLPTGPNALIDLSSKPDSASVRVVTLEGGNDTVIGSVSSDWIFAAGGNDSLLGGGGNDTLHAGTGNNWLQGGGGDDLIWAEGTQDTVFYGVGDSGTAGDVIQAQGHDITLKLGQGLNAAGMTLTPGGTGVTGSYGDFRCTDLMMSFNGGGDRILVNTGLFTRDSGAKVEFGDGSVVSMVSLLDKINTMLIPGVLSTGSAGSDTLIATAGNDTLQGLAGKDVLSAGAGDDLLVGGKGSDIYVIDLKDGHDTIVENESSLFATDVLKFTGSTSQQLWFQRAGNDLKVTVIGTHDDVTVQGWFRTSNARVEKIVASDGKTLQASKVQGLVNAMASFTPPADGVNALPANTPASLLKVVASSWA